MIRTDFEASALALQARHAALAPEQAGRRSRDRAAALGVSEAELVAGSCGPIRGQALAEPPQAIFRELGSLGRVMALTRNDWCVHERHGRYETIHGNGPVGLVLGPDIDLRVFFSQWKSAWSVEEAGRRSLQFFDAAGGAVHKIYATDHTDMAAYDALVEKFAAADPAWPTPAPLAPADATIDLADADTAAFRQAWLAMTDTHDFFGLLKQFKLARTDALAAAGADLAQAVEADVVERMLQQVAEQAIPIMCFVANRGMIQIHTGPVMQLRRTGPWYNVLDADFNLHLNTEAIASAWVVSKPTADGWVTSLEVFAANGELIVQFFGERKPGRPALPQWNQMLASFCREPLAV
jgi:putative hemin transport protein